MDDSCDIGCDGETVAMIPNQKTLNIDLPSSSEVDVSSMVSMKECCESPLSSWDSDVDVSSMVSMKEGCESPLSSWDSDLDVSSMVSMKEGCESPLSSWKNMDDGFLWEMDNKCYYELLKKFIEKEEELRVSNLKLQLSEQGNIKLAVQVENSEIQIDDMCKKLELKEDELYEQKKLLGEEISNLKIQNLKSENQLDDLRGELNFKKSQLDNVYRELNLKMDQLDNVRKELELKEEELNEQREISKEEAFKLMNQIKEYENQLDNVAILKRELETLVRKNEDNDINHQKELRKLTSTMFDMHVKSYRKKEELHSDIASLSKQKEELTSKLEDCESRNKELKQKVMQYEAENLKQKKLHSTQLTLLQDDISYLANKRLEGSFNYVFHPKKRNLKKK